ncbi:hypothetical protein NQZ68_026331 [Dissostichus eleginoides]|nr:hypothetical protein NQZ68_026331 [Dissostichus eleginoides]
MHGRVAVDKNIQGVWNVWLHLQLTQLHNTIPCEDRSSSTNHCTVCVPARILNMFNQKDVTMMAVCGTLSALDTAECTAPQWLMEPPPVADGAPHQPLPCHYSTLNSQ